MYIFVVLLVMGNFVAAIGPVRYSFEECLERVEDRHWLPDHIKDVSLEAVTLVCVRRSNKTPPTEY